MPSIDPDDSPQIDKYIDLNQLESDSFEYLGENPIVTEAYAGAAKEEESFPLINTNPRASISIEGEQENLVDIEGVDTKNNFKEPLEEIVSGTALVEAMNQVEKVWLDRDLQESLNNNRLPKMLEDEVSAQQILENIRGEAERLSEEELAEKLKEGFKNTEIPENNSARDIIQAGQQGTLGVMEKEGYFCHDFLVFIPGETLEDSYIILTHRRDAEKGVPFDKENEERLNIQDPLVGAIWPMGGKVSCDKVSVDKNNNKIPNSFTARDIAGSATNKLFVESGKTLSEEELSQMTVHYSGQSIFNQPKTSIMEVRHPDGSKREHVVDSETRLTNNFNLVFEVQGEKEEKEQIAKKMVEGSDPTTKNLIFSLATLSDPNFRKEFLTPEYGDQLADQIEHQLKSLVGKK